VANPETGAVLNTLKFSNMDFCNLYCLKDGQLISYHKNQIVLIDLNSQKIQQTISFDSELVEIDAGLLLFYE